MGMGQRFPIIKWRFLSRKTREAGAEGGRSYNYTLKDFYLIKESKYQTEKGGIWYIVWAG